MVEPEYKSIEQRLLVDSGLSEFAEYFGKGAYGIFVSCFRIPTTIRKLKNKQTFVQRKNKIFGEDSPPTYGSVMGCILGAFGVMGSGGVIVNEAVSNKNYAPLIVLGAINLVNGVFELGRLSKSKKENLELKTEKMARAEEATM